MVGTWSNLYNFLSLVFKLAAAEIEAKWWKGNLHTHSHWSDGDDYPEQAFYMIGEIEEAKKKADEI